MNISYHPAYEQTANELRNYLREQNLKHDINYIIGGDGSLFTYASFTQPNLLISPATSKGYYAGAKISNYQTIIKKIKPEHYRSYDTIEVIINNEPLSERAINDVLITEGLHKLSREIVYLNNQEIELKNSGILIYTHHGWDAFARNLNGKKTPEGTLGLIEIASSNSINEELIKTVIKIPLRQRNQEFKLYIDCKDIKPYNPNCTDRQEVHYRPYEIKPNDEIIIKLGKPVILIQP